MKSFAEESNASPIKRVIRPLLLAILALLLTATPPAWAGRKDSPTPAPSATPAPGPKFNPPIPVNHGAVKVKLPYFDQAGRLQMFFNIQSAFRVDLNHLQLEDAYMQTYDEHRAPDANVFMTKSMLDLDTRIVTSDVPVIVRRSDFLIEGQKMVFNTQTHVGHMSGHVHMVIYNRTEMAHASPTPGPAGSTPASNPGAQPQPAQHAISPAPAPAATPIHP
jgi:hypothetical protein